MLGRPTHPSHSQDDCIGTFVDPATGDVLQREWTNAFYNFDNASFPACWGGVDLRLCCLARSH